MINTLKNNTLSLFKFTKRFAVLLFLVLGFGSVTLDIDTKSAQDLFDGPNRANADTPHNCSGGSSGGGGCVSSNCVGGCSNSDGSSGGSSNSGSSSCGASNNCSGGCGGSSSCASSGTGSGLY